MFSLYALRRAVSVLQHVPQFSGKVRQPVKIYSAAGVDSNMSSISSIKYLYQVSNISSTYIMFIKYIKYIKCIKYQVYQVFK